MLETAASSNDTKNRGNDGGSCGSYWDHLVMIIVVMITLHNIPRLKWQLSADTVLVMRSRCQQLLATDETADGTTTCIVVLGTSWYYSRS